MNWKTYADCRDALVARIKAITGRNWREQLANVRQDAIRAFGADGLDETAYEAVLVEADAREMRMRDARDRRVREAGVPGAVDRLVPRAERAVAPVEDPQPQPESSPRPNRPRRAIPRDEQAVREARIQRRRYYAKLGRLPAKTAQFFTLGQQSVLAIILYEIKCHGACNLSIDAIASFARVCRRTVQSAIRLAQKLGLLAIRAQDRAPNVIAVQCAKLAAWIGSRNSKKSQEIQIITHPTKGADACTRGRTETPVPPVAVPEAPPAVEEVARVEAPEPEPVEKAALVEAPAEALEAAPEPAQSPPEAPEAHRAEVVRPAEQEAEPRPLDGFLVAIMKRIGLPVPGEGCDRVAEPGAG
ncbi:hypothetical protein [Methylobacterium nodulans]|uniref:hypothetical protein n=1 Tax=Methylobacterium nodulans TaxID=114616 RepID=UPI0012EDE501|nr:hypothetical protein [Methylobacterium nodulans]